MKGTKIIQQQRFLCLFYFISKFPFQASGKLMILDQLLQKLHEYGHRVLLFAQMTQSLDILQVSFLYFYFPFSLGWGGLFVSRVSWYIDVCIIKYQHIYLDVQDYLELRHYSYERLDGSIRAEVRFAAIRNFTNSSASQNKNSESSEQGVFVFLISTRAGGVGLNLMAADTVCLSIL